MISFQRLRIQHGFLFYRTPLSMYKLVLKLSPRENLLYQPWIYQRAHDYFREDMKQRKATIECKSMFLLKLLKKNE